MQFTLFLPTYVEFIFHITLCFIKLTDFFKATEILGKKKISAIFALLIWAITSSRFLKICVAMHTELESEDVIKPRGNYVVTVAAR